jgi:hypothetical protein
MDMETVHPFKSISDIVKEMKETDGVDSLYEFTSATFTSGEEIEPQCDCGNCSCK